MKPENGKTPVGLPRNQAFWNALHAMFPKTVDLRDLPRKLLRQYGLQYDCPSQGHYRIHVDGAKCQGLMFYPKSGRLVVQLNGKTRAVPFVSDDPRVLMIKAQSFL